MYGVLNRWSYLEHLHSTSLYCSSCQILVTQKYPIVTGTVFFKDYLQYSPFYPRQSLSWGYSKNHGMNPQENMTYTSLVKQEYKLIYAHIAEKKRRKSQNRNTIEIYFVFITGAKQLERNLHSIKMVKTELFQKNFHKIKLFKPVRIQYQYHTLFHVSGWFGFLHCLTNSQQVERTAVFSLDLYSFH